MATESPGYVGTQQDVILARVGAFVLDYFVSLIVAIGLGLGFALALNSDAGIYLGVVIGYAGYFIVLEGLYGQTVGKRLAGIIVVNPDGRPITFGQALVRNLLRIIDGLLNYAVGLIVMLISDDRQRIGDLAAETIVVRSR